MMPMLLLLTMIGIEINFLLCFEETLAFPILQRSTAMQYCNLVSRALTILAPMAAELPGTWPIWLIVFCLTFAVFTVQWLKSAANFEKVTTPETNKSARESTSRPNASTSISSGYYINKSV